MMVFIIGLLCNHNKSVMQAEYSKHLILCPCNVCHMTFVKFHSVAGYCNVILLYIIIYITLRY